MLIVSFSLFFNPTIINRRPHIIVNSANVNISGGKIFGYECHSYIPVSEYQPEDSSLLRHVFFTQVQGTVPFDREIKEYGV